MGHSADVRAVETQGSGPQQNLLTASRDGTACVWCPDLGSNREFVLSKTINSHTGYVSSLCVIPADVAAGREKCKYHLGHTKKITCFSGPPPPSFFRHRFFLQMDCKDRQK